MHLQCADGVKTASLHPSASSVVVFWRNSSHASQRAPGRLVGAASDVPDGLSAGMSAHAGFQGRRT
jgi:hypothetical protein